METNVDRARDLLMRLKRQRAMADKLKNDIALTQREVLPLLSVVDPNRVGLSFEFGEEAVAGFYVQNKTPEVLDQAGLIEALNKAGKFEAVSTTVLDMTKLDAEIKARNIRPALVQRFMSQGEAPAPYVRFAKPRKNSI